MRASLRTRSSGIAADLIFERRFLTWMLVLLFITYASLGKNIFTNGVDSDVTDDPISRNIGYVRMAVCLLTAGFYIVRYGIRDLVQALPWMYFPFVIWGTVSAAWSDDPWVTFRSASYLVTIFVAMPLVIHKLGLLPTIRVVLHMIAVVLILSFLIAIFLPTIGRHTSLTVSAAHAGRWRGIFGHKNGLGPWAAYGTIFLFTHARLVGGPRLYWTFAWFCSVSCLILSGSATSLVAAIFLVPATIAFRIRHKVSTSMLVVLLIVGTLGLALAFGIAKSQLFAVIGRDESFTGRTDVWWLAARHIADHFWFGAGYLSTGGTEFLEEVASTVLQEIPGAENAYLQAMLELGFIGLALFFVPVVIGLVRGFAWWPHLTPDNQRALEMLILITFAAMIMGCTESTPFICTGYDGVITFPAVFGLALLPKLSSIGQVRGFYARVRRRVPARTLAGEPAGSGAPAMPTWPVRV